MALQVQFMEIYVIESDGIQVAWPVLQIVCRLNIVGIDNQLHIQWCNIYKHKKVIIFTSWGAR
jgi:hypothetical protein